MNIKFIILCILLLFFSFLNMGCMAIAVITNEEMNEPSDSPRTITITSDPPCASVMQVRGLGKNKKIGETPLTLKIDPTGKAEGYDTYPLVVLEKEGYKPELVYLYKINEIIRLDNFACTLDVILIVPIILDTAILFAYGGIKSMIGRNTPAKGRYFVYDNHVIELVPLPKKEEKGMYYTDNQYQNSLEHNQNTLSPEEIQQQIILRQMIDSNNQQVLQNIQQQNQQFNLLMKNMTNQNQQISSPSEQLNYGIQLPQPSIKTSQPCYCGDGRCKICRGSGVQPGSTLGKNGPTKCHTCHGTGKCIVCGGKGKR